ncbi:MAG: type II secretion system protein GspG [Planctomycetes bacterium]|nr:type II secretion system protein GspG [Planctomycetota bacterium]
MIRATRLAAHRSPAGLFLAAAIALGCFAAPGLAQEALGADRLLPEGTILVFSVDDLAASSQAEASMPLNKILAEPDVQAFLDKPKTMASEALGKLLEEARKEKGFEDFNISLDQLMGGSYGRFFLALTHVRLPDLQAGWEMPDIGLILGIEGKEGAPDWQALLKEMVSRAAGSSGVEIGFQPVAGENYSYEELVGGEGERPPMLLGRVGDLQLFSLSHVSMKAVMDRVAGKSTEPSLADGARYQRAQKKLGLASPGSSRFYLNTEVAIHMVAEAVKLGLGEAGQTQYLPRVDQVIDMLGLLCLKEVASAGISEDGIAVSNAWIGTEGEMKGLMKLDPGKPVDFALLDEIPQDTASFALFSLDVSVLYDVVMDVVRTVDEGVYQEAQQALQGIGAQIAGEGNPPLDLRNDVLANIGPSFVFMQPQSASAMSPSMFFLAEVREPEKVIQSLKSILGFAGAMTNGALKLRSSAYKEVEIHQIEFGGDMAMIPLSPCFALAGDRLCISLNVGDLKRHLRRGEKPGPSIKENPEFQRFFSRLPEGKPLGSLSYTDVRYSVESAYGQLAMTLPMLTMAADFELPVDMALLPPTDSITKHLFSSLSYSLHEEDGALMASYGPVGGEIVGALVKGLVAGAVIIGWQRFEEERSQVTLAPTPTEPAQQTPEDQVRIDLSNLKAGVTIFKLQNSRLPDALEDLLQPTEAYPNGCLGPGGIPSDPWGNAYSYRRTESGYVLWSFGPNGADDSGEGDDLAVEKK